MSEQQVAQIVDHVIKGREGAYSQPSVLIEQVTKLINYSIANRDERVVHVEELEASKLISEAISKLGFESDTNVGRDLWELVSEDSQAQWIEPPDCEDGVYVSLVNVAENMATNQCYINFN